MAKIKTTKKAIIEAYGTHCYCTGYCELQFLFYYDTPRAYIGDKYGWACDIYELHDIAFCTGYRNMPGQKLDYTLVRKYNDLARQIVLNSSKDYQQRKEDICALQHEFIAELCNLEKKGV